MLKSFLGVLYLLFFSQVLRVLVEGVERLSLKAGPGIEGVSAIVVFSSHHAASMAKKGLVEGM